MSMKHTVFTALFCLCLALPVSARAADDAVPATKGSFTETIYSSIASDLPLMPGMAEKPDTLVMFDTPEGRIAEIAMDCPHGEVEVLKYYREVLPALGWYGENPQVWTRGDEELSIRFSGQRGVIFHIQPLPPGQRGGHKAAPNW